jgi:hypothetical protein
MRLVHAMSRPFRVGFAFAAGCLLTASCAVDARSLDDVTVYSPVPASTLVSRRDLQFKLGHVQRGACRLTILAYQAPGAEPSPIAVMSTWRSDHGALVSVHRLLQHSAGNGADLNVAALEHLYGLAIRQEPEATFRLADSHQACEVGQGSYSHAAFLRELVRQRQEAIVEVGPRSTSVAWHVVSMGRAPLNRTDADDVGVRVTSDQGPLEGATIFFNRAPHSGCVAKSRSDGIATCQLVDQHGDDESHSEDGKVPVVATFPGDVRGGRVLVPTTLVLHPAP